MDYETAYRWLHGDRVEYSGCRSAAEAMEAEIDRLRAALWQCFTDAGGDTDGKADASGISTDDLISTTTDCVKDLRLGYDEMGESNRCMRAALRAIFNKGG